MPPPAEELHRRLTAFYEAFDKEIDKLPRPHGSCAGCGRCCVGPPLYMTCSALEFEHALRRATGSPRVHFEAVSEGRPDKRLAFRTWTCPFYSHDTGCTVYHGRPLACRVFGPMSRQRIWWDFCVYQATSKVYEAPQEIPLWAEYEALVRDAGPTRGYVYPDQILYERPAVELLMNMPNPLAPLMNLRIPMSPIESETWRTRNV